MKFNILYTLLIFIMCSGFGTEQQDLYLKSLANIKNGNYEEAINNLSILIKENRPNANVYFERGKTYEKTGLNEMAIHDYKKAESLKPGIASYNLAVLYAREGETKKTLDYLRKHLTSSHKLPSHVIKLEPAFSPLHDKEEWLELWKENWYSRLELKIEEIEYYKKNEDYFEALDMIDNELKRYDKNHQLYALRGEIFMALENYKGAIINYKKALKINKRIPDYYISRGDAYYKLGKFKNSLDDHSKAIQLDKTNFDLYLKRAHIARLADKQDHAVTDLKKYLHFFPDDEKATFECGQLYTDMEEYDKAIECYTKNIQLDNSTSSYYIARGICYHEQGVFRKAYNDFSMALDLDPYNPSTYNLRGEVRLRMGDYDGACKDWQKATRKGSKKARANIIQYCN